MRIKNVTPCVQTTDKLVDTSKQVSRNCDFCEYRRSENNTSVRGVN